MANVTTKSFFVFAIIFLCSLTCSDQLGAQQSRPCGPDSIPPALKVFFPQGVAGADFRPACREHDRCYTKGSGRLKANCDCEFLRNMQSACQNSHNPRRCNRRARFLYRLTVRYGDSAFGT